MPVAPIPFTPPHISLNRVSVVDLPGIRMDDEVRGRRAFDLLSVPAMARYARMVARELVLPAAFLDDGPEMRARLPHFIQASLNSANPLVREAAENVLQRIGRNLGHMLLALHRGDPANRDAREDWSDADWERWIGIKRVWLAGGLSSGALGQAIHRYAREWLAEVGSPCAIDVQVSPFADLTSLVGAARYLPPDAGCTLCFDFGQTTAKRAIVKINGAAIAHFDVLPSANLSGQWPLDPGSNPALVAAQCRDSVVEVLAATLDLAIERGAEPGPEIMLCVAGYVDGGRIVGKGAYGALMALAPDARTLIADAVAQRTTRAHRFRLIHDGTAAAAAFAGQANTAVIALGTALGVSFAPAAAGLLNIDAIPGSSTLLKGSLTDAHRTT